MAISSISPPKNNHQIKETINEEAMFLLHSGHDKAAVPIIFSIQKSESVRAEDFIVCIRKFTYVFSGASVGMAGIMLNRSAHLINDWVIAR